MTQESNQRLTKNERREAARAQAKAAREAQVKKEKRNRLFVQGGIVVGVLAVIAIIALVVTQMVKPAGPGPKNMASGGVVFEGENFEVRETPAIGDGEKLVAQEVNRETVPLDITIYVDFMCPACGAFEQEASAMLEQWVGSGQATLQVYPVNFLDSQSKGTRYSTRAANAFACVAEQQPDAAWDYYRTLLSAEVQPAEGTTGLTNDRLLEVAVESGASDNRELRQCVQNVPFADFISKTNRLAFTGPLLGLEPDTVLADGRGGMLDADADQHISGTPAIIVNGQQAPSSPTELEQFMLKKFAELSGDTAEADGDEGADAPEEDKKD
ncbi:DsbA family protein [Leucobacter chinensis]|uniref:DsbA family protein n=1 Tax=Leucobacter chinensis TaxID=2851010 RepID=UPI001C212B48|nr:thioredoxin domain-containing protein [Leucobacter chinensis]